MAMQSYYTLYDFMNGCGGNWRNAVFVPCTPCTHPCQNGRRGSLLTADSQGRPIVVSVRRLEAAVGKCMEPDECIGCLSKGAFETLFARYLTWQLDSDRQCPLCQMDQQVRLLL